MSSFKLNPLSRIAASLIAGLLVTNAHAVTLYDPGLGTTPASQGWTSIVLGIAPAAVSGGVLNFDTTASSATQAGFSRTDQTLDSDAGFELDFRLQVLSETHGNNNRAGFSVIALDSAHVGVELSFWTDQVWVQSGPTFTKGESAALTTTSAIDYRLTLLDGFYSLQANGSQVLTGAMRDYSSFGIPYNTANFLFFGDDASSSKASIALGSVSLTSPAPEPASALLMGLGLAGLITARRRNATRPAH